MQLNWKLGSGFPQLLRGVRACETVIFLLVPTGDNRRPRTENDGMTLIRSSTWYEYVRGTAAYAYSSIVVAAGLSACCVHPALHQRLFAVGGQDQRLAKDILVQLRTAVGPLLLLLTTGV